MNSPMACLTCKAPAGLFARVSRSAARNSLLDSRNIRTELVCSLATATPPLQTQRRLHSAQPQPTRQAEKTTDQARLRKLLLKPAANALVNNARRTTQSYLIYGATDSAYKTCSSQAAYTISEEDRKADRISLGPDGEEIGVGGGMWHHDFEFLPTFSTWSQVTMLHLYLLIVRLRCLDQDVYQTWQAQLIDHFFHEAEEKMDLLHGMSSRALRQRNLQDLFLQWRGLILAYDEGLVKGDAVLASALWRNLFKGREDVDLRVLAAVVSWMRLCLKNLDSMPDEALIHNVSSVFKWPAKSELLLVDRPSRALNGAYHEAAERESAPEARR